MKFTALASLLAAGVSGAPTQQETRTAGVEAFNLMSLRSASPIHFGSFSAVQSNIFINYPQGEQGATCDGDAQGTATFSLKDGALSLYNSNSDKAQKVFVDRSGMGQGKIGYISGDQNPPRNSELKGWTSEKNGEFSYLKFDGASLLACPAATEDAWVVWLSAGIDQPGGNDGCLGLSAMVQPDEKPVSCEYTQ